MGAQKRKRTSTTFRPLAPESIFCHLRATAHICDWFCKDAKHPVFSWRSAMARLSTARHRRATLRKLRLTPQLTPFFPEEHACLLPSPGGSPLSPLGNGYKARRRTQKTWKLEVALEQRQRAAQADIL